MDGTFDFVPITPNKDSLYPLGKECCEDWIIDKISDNKIYNIKFDFISINGTKGYINSSISFDKNNSLYLRFNNFYIGNNEIHPDLFPFPGKFKGIIHL